MQKDDLIKKLEKTEVPEIKTPNLQAKLKQELREELFKEKKPVMGVFPIFKRAMVPIGAGLLLIALVLIFSNLLFPQYTALAKAREIALQHPQVKAFIEQGGEIKDIKIVEGKGYVLVSSPRIEKTETTGLLAEVELDQKRVAKIEEIKPSAIPLTQAEKEKVHKIIHTHKTLKTVEPEIEIKEIKALPSLPHKLIKKDKGVEILHKKKATVIYKVAETQWQGEVNLHEEELEDTRPLEEVSN